MAGPLIVDLEYCDVASLSYHVLAYLQRNCH